jgi:hypothetical protein
MHENSATRRHLYKLYLTDSRINLRKYFFSQHIVNVWNNLNPDVINFTSLTAFVNLLSTYDMSQYVPRQHDNVVSTLILGSLG